MTDTLPPTNPAEWPFGARPQHLACEGCGKSPLCGCTSPDGTRFRCAWCEFGGRKFQKARLPVGTRVRFTTYIKHQIARALVGQCGAITEQDSDGVRVSFVEGDFPVLVRWSVAHTLEKL